jgi:LysR family glycine cleavage system transcriptional activator
MTCTDCPRLKAMQALEALERLGTAQAVADELGLTRSAVSHILRRLEG